MTTDQTQQNTVSIAEAAIRLHISPEAVRKRISRGSLQGYKVGRAWYVIVPRRPDSDQTRPPDVGTQPDTSGGLEEALRAHIASLEKQLDERTEELRRKDVILQTLAQRLPELPPGNVTEAPEKKRRSWWPWRH